MCSLGFLLMIASPQLFAQFSGSLTGVVHWRDPLGSSDREYDLDVMTRSANLYRQRLEILAWWFGLCRVDRQICG
jgi:hypothetical protein